MIIRQVLLNRFSMFQITVGVDGATKKFDVARFQDGKYRHKGFPNPPSGFAAFLAWLARFGPEPGLIALEATGASSLPLAEFLADRGLGQRGEPGEDQSLRPKRTQPGQDR